MSRGHREQGTGKEGGEIRDSNPQRDKATGRGIARKSFRSSLGSIPKGPPHRQRGQLKWVFLGVVFLFLLLFFERSKTLMKNATCY